MSEVSYAGVTDEVSKLIGTTIEKLTTVSGAVASGAGEPSTGRLFFPNGIELIYLKMKVGDNVELTFALAGEKARYPGASSVEKLLVSGDEAPNPRIEQ